MRTPVISLENRFRQMARERTLEEAKRIVLQERKTKEGVTCPCCGRYVREYVRKLNTGMARAFVVLVWIYQKTSDWVHVDEISVMLRNNGWTKSSYPTGDMNQLAHWELILEKPHDAEEKRTSGCWRPTLKGLAFAEGRIAVPSHMIHFNKEILGWSERTITVREALMKIREFNYEELMALVPRTMQ